MLLRTLDVNLIVLLQALLTHRNVTRAAKVVGLSQPSMSHALARLRSHFDDPLLVTSGRDSQLTARAKALISPVNEAVWSLERVFSPLENFEPGESERLFRIAAPDNLAFYVLPKLAKVLSGQAPGVQVRVCGLPQGWAAAMQRGDFDLKLGRHYAVPEGFESHQLFVEPFGCVVRQDHMAPPQPTLTEYAGFDHLMVVPNGPITVEPTGEVDRLLAEHGLRRRIAMTVPHFMVAPFIVAESDMVLTAPRRLLAPLAEPLGLRFVEVPVSVRPYRLSLIWAKRSHEDEAHAWLRNKIVHILEASKAELLGW